MEIDNKELDASGDSTNGAVDLDAWIREVARILLPDVLPDLARDALASLLARDKESGLPRFAALDSDAQFRAAASRLIEALYAPLWHGGTSAWVSGRDACATGIVLAIKWPARHSEDKPGSVQARVHVPLRDLAIACGGDVEAALRGVQAKVLDTWQSGALYAPKSSESEEVA